MNKIHFFLSILMLTSSSTFGMDNPDNSELDRKLQAFFSTCERLDRLANDLNNSQSKINEKFCNAVKEGYVKKAETWITLGADVNQPMDNENTTPLIFATKQGNSEMVKFLVDHGANVTITDSNGKNALEHACITKNSEVINHLEQKNSLEEKPSTD